ncbi:hypothetical protein NC651_002474 [Populus alba x Populus x berolinensis]|nr:hypothetical protein NC651_002474 [Populus alba x Populus x berolinensis]
MLQFHGGGERPRFAGESRNSVMILLSWLLGIDWHQRPGIRGLLKMGSRF